jgi:hypothetical protein
VRGRLIFQFLADLRRLDTDAMSTQAPGYDQDFKELALLDDDGDGVGDVYRRELPPVQVPCQVEPQTIEALRMTASGNTPQSNLDLVFHFKDLERLGLVEAQTGEALIRPSDRLSGLFDTEGNLVWAVRTPPGLYVTEARPAGFGLFRRRPRRNLLIVSFNDRPAGR